MFPILIYLPLFHQDHSPAKQTDSDPADRGHDRTNEDKVQAVDHHLIVAERMTVYY